MITPILDRVVLRPIREEKTKGGIIIPDQAKDTPVIGEVLAVGPGKRDERGVFQPTTLKAGDKVIYKKWCVETDRNTIGDDLYVIKESDVEGILE